MAEIADSYTRNTSPYYAYSCFLFETADITSFFWQPLLKAFGRAHLEMAGLQARQAQALVRWSQQVMRPASPFDLINANAEFWRTIADQYADAVPKFADAVGAATRSVAPVVLPMPAKPSHDTLILLDREKEAEEGPLERKVA